MVKRLVVQSKKKKVLGVRRPGRRIAVRLPSVRNKLEAYAGMSQTSIRWIIGHGIMLTRHVVVPPKTFVVFLAQPGFLAQSIYIFDPEFERLWSDRTAMSQFIRGEIPGPNYDAFRTWKNRIYGPGDHMPETYIEMFDERGSSMTENNTAEQRHRDVMDRFCGVKRVGGGHIYHNITSTVGNIIRKKGPGIYFVLACRGTVIQDPDSLERVFRTNATTPARNVTGFVNREHLRNLKRSYLQTQRKRYILKLKKNISGKRQRHILKV